MEVEIVAKRQAWLLVLGSLVLALGVLSWQLQVQAAASTPNLLAAHVLDVGQGSATLIETPTGEQVLVDGGAGPMVLRALSEQLPWYDRTLDMVVASHPDADHIGGLVHVLQRYHVDHIIWNPPSQGGSVVEAFAAAVAAESGAVTHLASSGQRWQIGASTTITVLAPQYRPQQIPTNAGSVVLRVEYGKTSILLPGDVPKAVERYLVDQYGTALESTVLQLGHHGSDTSTASVFLKTVRPAVAIVSAGAGNPYGHPAPEVVDRVQAHGVPLFNTATDGTITFLSNGERMWREP